jgi:NAD dependent epimerase/dehydratase
MNYTGKRVLVTGADGFIGSHLVEQLVSLGAEVTALAQYNSFDSVGWLDDLVPHVRDSLEIARGDVRDKSYMSGLAAGKDIVFHLAALIGIPYSYDAAQSYVDVNVAGTLNILEAARWHDVGRVVHTSTSEVYGTALYEPIDEKHPLQGQSPYSASKIGADMMAEAYARSFDMPVVILRPFNTYGPRQSERAVIPTVIRQALDDGCESIRIGDTTPRRDFCFVEDTASAFAAAGSAEGLEFGAPYNAGTGTAVSVAAMIEEVRRLTNTTKPVEEEAVRLRPTNSEVRALLADANRLRTASGWTPGHDLAAGLERTIDWWRQRLTTGSVRTDSGYMT